MTDNEIEALLEPILNAAGKSVSDFHLYPEREALRRAMRSALDNKVVPAFDTHSTLVLHLENIEGDVVAMSSFSAVNTSCNAVVLSLSEQVVEQCKDGGTVKAEFRYDSILRKS